MNITELVYVTETAFCGSINSASKKLLVAQPNISRAISNLEKEYGIRIFERSPKGVMLTRDGQRFIEHSKRILDEIDSLGEALTKSGNETTELRVLLPKASYASMGFVNYVSCMNTSDSMNLHVRECSSMEALDGILSQDYHMAVIRFETDDEEYYRSIIHLRELEYEEIMKYQFRLLVNKDSPIVKMDITGYDDLKDYIELRQGDAKKPNGDYIDTLDTPENIHSKRRIYVYERGSQFALLNKIETAYMWVSPMPQEVMDINGLVQKQCKWQKKWMKDVLIYPKRILRNEELAFMKELKNQAAKVLK